MINEELIKLKPYHTSTLKDLDCQQPNYYPLVNFDDSLFNALFNLIYSSVQNLN